MVFAWNFQALVCFAKQQILDFWIVFSNLWIFKIFTGFIMLWICETASRFEEPVVIVLITLGHNGINFDFFYVFVLDLLTFKRFWLVRMSLIVLI